MDVPEIDVDELARRARRRRRVIDVREPDEYDEAPRARRHAHPAGRGARAGRRGARRRARCYVICARAAAAAGPPSSCRPRASTPSTSPAAPWPGSTPGHPVADGRSSRERHRRRRPTPRYPLGRRPTSVRRRRRRAASDADRVRARHRVPPRAHLLPAARAGAARPGTTTSSLVDPLAVDLAPLAGCSTAPALVRHARRQPGPRGPRAGVRHGARAACSTPRSPPGSSGYGTPSLGRAASSGELGVAPAQGRPPHRLAAPPARRRPARATPPPTSPTCSSCTTGCATELDGRGPADVGARRVRAAARRAARAPRDPDEAWLADQGGPPAPGPGRAASPRRWPRGASGGRAELDQPVRFVLPDLAVVGIAQRPPPTPRRPAAASGASTTATCGAASASELLAAVADGLEPRRDGAGAPAAATSVDRDLRPAVTLVSAWVSQLARDLEHRHLAARHPGRPRGAPARRRRRPPAHGLAGRRCVGEPIRRLVDGRGRPRLRRRRRPRARGALRPARR